MNNYLKTLAPLTLCIAATGASAQETDAQVERLQQQLNNIQQQLNAGSEDRLRFNGFMSTGYATASNNAGFAGVTERSVVSDLSLLALQGTFQVSDKSQAIFQLVSRGSDDWEPVMEWAYFSHRPNNNVQLRAGKMRLPFFMYSDSLEVGYSQPWVRPPQSVYGPVGVTSYVGADATYSANLAASSLQAQVFTGFTDESATLGGLDTSVELRNIGGLVLSWTDFVWSARAVAATGETTVQTSLPGVGLADGDRGNFFGVSGGYDDGRWQISAEATRVEVDGSFVDTESAYISVGRRFGRFTPYAVLGTVDSVDDNERVGEVLPIPGQPLPLSMLNVSRDEHSLGVRWDIVTAVALKMDVTRVSGFGGNAGGLSNLATPEDSTNVFTVKLDATF